MVDDAEDSPSRRARAMWLSSLMIQSHLPSGENCKNRAPDDMDFERVTFETCNPSPSSNS